MKCIFQELDVNIRYYIGALIKAKDAHFRNYFSYRMRKKEPENEKEFYKTLFGYTDLLGQNENMTLFIQLWHRKEPFSTFYIQYQKQVDTIKQSCYKDLDKERAKIRHMQLGKVILDVPKRFEHLFFIPEKQRDPKHNKRTQQELNTFADIEMNLSLCVAQVSFLMVLIRVLAYLSSRLV